MSVQSKMTAIASPIRTLTGATGKLSLDQMATQLTDANTAKSAILAALTEKGVTTTGSEGIGEIAALVESIEAGGGGVTIKTGTITPASASSSLTVTHGLGAVPKLFVVFTTFGVGAGLSGLVMYSSASAIELDGYTPALFTNKYQSGSGLTAMVLPILYAPDAATVNTQSITVNISRYSATFSTNRHEWFAIAWEE